MFWVLEPPLPADGICRLYEPVWDLEMNNLYDLKAGYRWARHRLGSETLYGDEYTRWVVVEIEGKAPFLEVSIVFNPCNQEGISPFGSLRDPDLWQFGPELNLPPQNYVEVEAPKDEK